MKDGIDDGSCEEFWKVPEGSPSDVKTAEEGGSDEEHERMIESQTILYEVEEGNKIKEVGREK